MQKIRAGGRIHSLLAKVAEVVMPHRRTVQKGSFASHFDDLLKHFSHHQAKASNSPPVVEKKSARPKHKPKVSIHQALFERAEH